MQVTWIARDIACTAYSFGCHESGFLCKNADKKGDDVDDEISRRRLDGFAIRLSARSSVSNLARIRAFPRLCPESPLSFFPLSYQTYQFSVSIPPIPFIFFCPPLSLFLHRGRIYLSAASSSDRIEESSETAAISAEIESQNGENDCKCFPPCRRGSVKERGCTGAKEDLRRRER